MSKRLSACLALVAAALLAGACAQSDAGITTGRVLRGGSWISVNPSDLRASARKFLWPGNRSDHVGFRCAR